MLNVAFLSKIVGSNRMATSGCFFNSQISLKEKKKKKKLHKCNINSRLFFFSKLSHHLQLQVLINRKKKRNNNFRCGQYFQEERRAIRVDGR